MIFKYEIVGRLEPNGIAVYPELAQLKPNGVAVCPKFGQLKPNGVAVCPELAQLKPNGIAVCPKLAQLKPNGVKSIILCKSLNVVISSGHHAHYTCKNVRALFSQFSWKSINIEPIKRSAEAMFG